MKGNGSPGKVSEAWKKAIVTSALKKGEEEMGN